MKRAKEERQGCVAHLLGLRDNDLHRVRGSAENAVQKIGVKQKVNNRDE